MSAQSQSNRVEQPVPDIGQLVLDAGELDLSDPRTGTFEFPPRPLNAADVVAFWGSVDIPDEVLVSTQIAYDRRREAEVRIELSQYKAIHKEPAVDHPKHAEWVNGANAHLQKVFDQERDIYNPAHIEPNRMRAVVRAAKMAEAARDLSPTEAAKVMALKVKMEWNLSLTVAQVMTAYRLEPLIPHMADRKRRSEIAELPR